MTVSVAFASGGAPYSLGPEIVKHEVPWSEKEDSRLFFRGGPSGAFPTVSTLQSAAQTAATPCQVRADAAGSGIFYTTWRWDWRSSQRNRLSVVGDESVEYDVPVMVDRGGSGIVRESFAHSELVERYLDVRLVPQVGDGVIALGGMSFRTTEADNVRLCFGT
jgi:hypothetical protein